MRVSRILHAGYVFQCGQTQIVFDPIFENPFSRNCYAFPKVEFNHQLIRNLKFDAVFISHYHDDHCSLESLNLLDLNTPIYIYCLFEEMFSMIRELGFLNVHSIEINKPIRIGEIEVIPRQALDADVDSIFHIKAKGLNILNVVDSWIDDETLGQLSKTHWDMVLWPFQAMRELEVLSPSRARNEPVELPPEWLRQLKILNPKHIVPSSCQFLQESWSWYNHWFFPISYQKFENEIKKLLPQSKVIRMNPSVSVALNKKGIDVSSPLSWIKPVGDQDADYDFWPELTPPTTAEVAKNFAPLSEEQAKQIDLFCKEGLIKKYKLLESSEEKYFQKPRLWQLSLYDHQGKATHFYYKIQGVNIELVEKTLGLLAWTTEVPAFKLYAALELGESLTSMYMRINDRVLAPEIEKGLQGVELIEDPLVRCLFSGVFGAYQKAQLKKLKACQRTNPQL